MVSQPPRLSLGLDWPRCLLHSYWPGDQHCHILSCDQNHMQGQDPDYYTIPLATNTTACQEQTSTGRTKGYGLPTADVDFVLRWLLQATGYADQNRSPIDRATCLCLATTVSTSLGWDGGSNYLSSGTENQCKDFLTSLRLAPFCAACG